MSLFVTQMTVKAPFWGGFLVCSSIIRFPLWKLCARAIQEAPLISLWFHFLFRSLKPKGPCAERSLLPLTSALLALLRCYAQTCTDQPTSIFARDPFFQHGRVCTTPLFPIWTWPKP
jgi:hypothetical protein